MQTLILNLHGIGPVPGQVPGDEDAFWISRDGFRNYLDQICALSATRPVHITFDDGNTSDLEIALPLLQEYSLKADFFVCAGRVGQPMYLDGAGIRELIDCGMGVGSHGMDHVNWHRADSGELQREIVEAQGILADICGRPVLEFAIPFGAYDRRVLTMIRKSGGTCAYTSDGGLADMSRFLRPRNTLRAGPPAELAKLEGGKFPQVVRKLKVAAKSLRGMQA